MYRILLKVARFKAAAAVFVFANLLIFMYFPWPRIFVGSYREMVCSELEDLEQRINQRGRDRDSFKRILEIANGKGNFSSGSTFGQNRAIAVLGNISEKYPEGIEVISEYLLSNNAMVRDASARSAVKFGSLIEPAKAALINVLTEHDKESAGSYAAEALGNFPNYDLAVIKALESVRNSQSPATCRSADLALKELRKRFQRNE